MTLQLNPHWQALFSPEGIMGRNLTVAWQEKAVWSISLSAKRLRVSKVQKGYERRGGDVSSSA
jgi:hypothetical protein